MKYFDDPRNPFTRLEDTVIDKRSFIPNRVGRHYYALSAHGVGDYNVFLLFYDLQYGIFDMSRLFTGDWKLRNVFAPLRDDEELCQRVYLLNCGQVVAWTREMDLPAAAFYYDRYNLWPDVELKNLHELTEYKKE